MHINNDNNNNDNIGSWPVPGLALAGSWLTPGRPLAQKKSCLWFNNKNVDYCVVSKNSC